MNRALPEMLHCLNTPENVAENFTDISVLERQRARLKWQQEQQQQQQQRCYFQGNEFSSVFSVPAHQPHQQFEGSDMGLNELVNRAVKVDPGLVNGLPDFGQFTGDFGFGSGFELNYGISRTTSCPTAPAIAEEEAAVVETKQRDTVLPEKISSTVGRESFKKRKADKNQNLKAVVEEDYKEKRIKGCSEEGESKITEQNSDDNSKNTNNNNNNNNKKRETSTDTSKENSKVTEVQKPDYIHVRARRGQATDSHSLAERVRREKISERMKYLQDLVPGCNKITGKAGMLNEIINYVQSLQFNPLQQVVPCGGLELGITAPDMTLRRTISTPVSFPTETSLDSSYFNQIQSSSAWDANLQNLYNAEFLQARSTSLQAQQFTGSNEASNLKMEM